MRVGCLDCVCKHVASALALGVETLCGYPLHRWIAIGELAQAEAESCVKWVDLSVEIRAARKGLEAGESVDLEGLLIAAVALREDEEVSSGRREDDYLTATTMV